MCSAQYLVGVKVVGFGAPTSERYPRPTAPAPLSDPSPPPLAPRCPVIVKLII